MGLGLLVLSSRSPKSAAFRIDAILGKTARGASRVRVSAGLHEFQVWAGGAGVKLSRNSSN